MAALWMLVLAIVVPASCAAEPLHISRAADHQHMYNLTTAQLSPQAQAPQVTTQSVPDPYFGSRIIQVCAAESTPGLWLGKCCWFQMMQSETSNT